MWHFRQEAELRHFLYERKYRKGDHWVYVYPDDETGSGSKSNSKPSIGAKGKGTLTKQNELRKAAAASKDIGRAQSREYAENKKTDEEVKTVEVTLKMYADWNEKASKDYSNKFDLNDEEANKISGTIWQQAYANNLQHMNAAMDKALAILSKNGLQGKFELENDAPVLKVNKSLNWAGELSGADSSFIRAYISDIQNAINTLLSIQKDAGIKNK